MHAPTRHWSRWARRALRASSLLAVVGAVTFGQPGAALALQGGEDPSQLPVLIDKRYGGRHDHQLSLMFATTTFTKLTQGIGGYLAYQYNFIDMLGIELSGGFFSTSETFIMQRVRFNTGDEEPFLPDQYALQWTAMMNLVFVPVYGKMSFASEFDPAFDLFLLAGWGVAGVRRGFGNVGEGEPERFESELTWTADVGAGLRFYINDLFALRFEFRSWFYPEPGGNEVPEGGREISGVTSVLNFQAGVQFSFGGDS